MHSEYSNFENEQDIFDDNAESEKIISNKIIKENLLRRNSEIDTTDPIDNTDMNTNIYEDIKRYGLNEDKLEISNSNSSNEDSPKYYFKGIEENETFSNITDFEFEKLESAQASLEGSVLRRIKNSFIDEKGMLINIIESENITIIQPGQENLNSLTEEEEKLKSTIFNNNNEIPRIDEEDFTGKDIPFDISNIKCVNFNNVSLYDNITDEELARNIFIYFDNFSYEKYDILGNDELKFRVLKEFKEDFIKTNKDFDPSQIEVEHSKLPSKNNKRYLQNSGSYYGMKNYVNEKIIFKYNLIGLILEGIVVNEINVATGISDSYIRITLGSINMNIKFNSMKTNLHIIIKNSQQMTFNMLALLYNSNEDLIQRNKIYSDIILNLEKNVTKLLEESYDYSGLFKESLENLYNQVKNFSGEFFNELIELIENVYNNYTIILNRTENEEFDIMNEIRNITKNEYINYINKMFDSILTFKNKTLLLLKNIKNEVDKIQTFQIDILYDIIDIIDNSILIFKDFNKKLFQAVDRGVSTFKYNLKDYIEEIIGELLYLTDFLSVNINKNEILINAIEFEKRQNVTIKLKNFRNIVLRIIEILNNNIINDYEEEMSPDNENSIKYSKEYIIKNSLEEIDNNSTIIIGEIKGKIFLMNYYETYSEDIKIINEINNNSLLEFNNEMYEEVLSSINKISPEYLNKNSDLIKNKNYLFSLSDNLTSTINQEIDDINNYINLYSSNFIKDNNYILDFNIYNFRKCFKDEILSSLFKEFKTIVNNSLQIHFIDTINKNYDLAYEYMEDVFNYFFLAPHYKILGNIYIENYNKYKDIFINYANLALSDEFSHYLSDNFYNVSNYILNHINKKIESIKKYYFNEADNPNFYKLELVQEEIYKISNKINNFFHEFTFLDITKMIANFSEVIQTLNEKKLQRLDDLFDSTFRLAEETKNFSMNCDIIQLTIGKKRLWYTLFLAYEKIYKYSCKVNVKSRNNINKIVKNLSTTKGDLSAKFNILINNFINKFDVYLNSYINISQTLYNNLYQYTEEKINNNKNIELILNRYQNVLNNMLSNNTDEKILEKSFFYKDFNKSTITNITTQLEKNIFEMNNKFYKNYFLNNNKFYLEYPDEVILKINQSINNLKSNNKKIKNKINLSFNNRLKNIISSTEMFISDNHKFNFEYIINNIKREKIFDKYFIYKTNHIKNFFKKEINSNQNSNDKLILDKENYDYYIDNIENNYSNFSSDLIKEIDENFTKINCLEYMNSDFISDSSLLFSDEYFSRNCSKERYTTELNYSKYNFNVVKFRTEISNSMRFPEMIDQLINGLNYNNIIDKNEIKEIDNILNNKNILFIASKSKDKINAIQKEFILNIQDSVGNFSYEFINNNNNKLTNNYKPFLDIFKNILNFSNIIYNNNISETYKNLGDNIDKLLNQFNSTLFEYINNIIKNYNYFSMNLTKIYNNYSLLIEKAFNYYNTKINNLKVNNNFYSIPKIILDEIFVEKRKNIEQIINKFSNKYEFDFESIGFKFNIEKELDLYLKKFYINYEFNNIYDYFELMEENKNIYTNKLLNDISFVKSFQKNKFNFIFTKIIEYFKNKNNYVENDFIEKIKFNKSECQNALSNLYINISNDLNETNITDTEDYITNNCTLDGMVNALLNNSYDDICLNISEINVESYLNNYKLLFSDCQTNNFYNYTYIILDKFEEEKKNNLDEIISNIINTITSKIIDENYLNDFIRNYYIENTSLEINMNNYMTYFEEILETNSNTNTSKEPEYKNLIYDILIESFNISYSNNIKLYIINEAMNSIDILISDKINIFIDYFSNKLKNDFEYYSLLLDQMEELGNSSKLSIKNLFSKIPKKLNDTIYYFIEEELFYHIDIFFRENKNIFIDNFLNFYLNSEYHLNLSIYKIEDYVIEIISDNTFNKTLNNISSNLITEIKSQIKGNIRNVILTKINSFSKECDLIFEKIQKKLNKINTSELSDEMVILVQLLNNHSNLLENQNNKYSFIVGNEPFDKLNIFITQELKPPLSLILEKYNFIEEELLNRVQTLAEQFPDCYSEVKENLLGTKIETIDGLEYQINPSLFDYQNILINETKDYINKLIHYIYINGLQTMDKSCEEVNCGIPKNIFRRLDNEEITKILKVYKGHPNFVDKTEIEKKINKKINLTNKRKTSSFPEYTSDMGTLSESDVIYYLTNLQNTILKFSKSYLGKQFLNINSTSNKFLTKINVTYLEELRLSFDYKLRKFSTILTENNMDKLKNIILKQFYQIEDYVYKSSNLVRNKINHFLYELNKTSEIIESLSGYIHNQVFGYYNILYTIIQNKYKTIDDNILPVYDIGHLLKASENTKKIVLDIINSFHSNIQLNFDLTYILHNCLSSENIRKIMEKMEKYTKVEKSFEQSFDIPFPAFPLLQIRIGFEAGAGIGFFATIEPDWSQLKFNSGCLCRSKS